MECGNAMDGGWGWMIVLSAHFMHFLTSGLDRTSGVFYREILADMKDSSASTVGFAALSFSSKYLTGPVAGVLCKYFGCRRVMMTGGILACSGVLLSSFCRSLALIYLTLGFMTGVGNGLAYTSGLLAVNDYFSRRKATALGLATAGTGVGSFVLPLLTQYLIQEYSFRGCMLILSGLSLNLTVCGALLYPLPQAPDSEDNAEAVAQRTAQAAEEETYENAGEKLELNVQTEETDRLNEPVDKRAGDISAEVTDEENSLQSNNECARSDGRCRHFFADLWAKFDMKLFLNWQFSVFALAAMFWSGGFRPVAVILPHHAQLRGLTETTSVLLISIAGACDTVSRFSLGLLFDVQCLVPHRRRIWTLGMLLTASSITAFAFMHSLAPFVFVSVIFGFTSGLFVSQFYCVLGDVIGRERCRTGIGLLILIRGVGVAIGPPLAGAIKDVTGSYQLSFCVLSSSTFVGFVCLCTLDVAQLLRGWRRCSSPDGVV